MKRFHHAKAYVDEFDDEGHRTRHWFNPSISEGTKERIRKCMDPDYVPPRCRTELTEIGEQFVIPGCEKKPIPKVKQLGLWD